LRWKKPLSDLKGKNISLEIKLKNATVYAIEF